MSVLLMKVDVESDARLLLEIELEGTTWPLLPFVPFEWLLSELGDVLGGGVTTGTGDGEIGRTVNRGTCFGRFLLSGRRGGSSSSFSS